MTRWLVRFGYDGRPFAGWARQPARSTVEGAIDRGVARHGLPVSRAPYSVASRTDRGVSAVGNALALTSALPGASLLRSLNGLSPEIFFTHATPVDESFRVRSATSRVYLYFESPTPEHLERWRSAARLFTGEIDARSFGRGLPGDWPQWRNIESVRLRPEPTGLEIEVTAPSFVWGMVRKIVAALREIGSGRLDEPRLQSAIVGRRRLALPMAEPEPLVLWDVRYPVRWAHTWLGPNRSQIRAWSGARTEALARQRVLETLHGGAPRPTGAE